MGIPIFQVDSFTEKPFAGNPAGVCILDRASSEVGDEVWMQMVAREMNLSETAFVYKIEDGYNLRWFTPVLEVDLCGHATLASAHILFTEGYLETGKQARFQTKSGLLRAELKGDWIQLDFPAEPEAPTETPPELARALGVSPGYVGKNRFAYLVEVNSEDTVRGIRPDFELLRSIPGVGIIVTSRADSEVYDFCSRFFAPGAGINEDPVTGSAHCCLGPYWGKKLGKKEMVGYQASARGGIVKVRLAGDRVFLGGKAVTVFKGELTV
jgi:PhzF family phenazine biosynthesis protein